MNNFFPLYLQAIYINTFLASQTLQISPLIKNGNHEAITFYSYSYDLTLTLLITYAINCISQLKFLNITKLKLIFYHTITTASAIIFALLGEVKFLQNFTISGDFWKHLSLREIFVFLLIGIPLVYLSIRDYATIYQDKRCKNIYLPTFAILILFVFNYILLIVNSAHHVHYHIHHAIFASFMAVQFNDLNDYLCILGNGIYMGVIIEGISFYGLQELYIFMTNSSSVITNFNVSLLLTFISIVLWSVIPLSFLKK